jgi:aldehyde oxidoreductase
VAQEQRGVRFTVNGVEADVAIGPDTRLSDVLRRDLGLTGTKIGCGDGQCGTCVVLVDGKAVRSCTYLAHRVEGKQVLTVEGLAAAWSQPGQLHPLQKAFIDHGAVQCGFCTPGLLMAAAGLWHKMVDAGTVPDAEEIKVALARHACRCTGYASILRAVQSAFHEQQAGEPLPPVDMETMEPLRVIGHSYPRPDAVAKVTGTAKFTDDYTFADMLYGATLRAAHPHGPHPRHRHRTGKGAAGRARRPDAP